MVVLCPNGEVCEDDEYYGIFYDEEMEDYDDANDFIDNDYKEDTIYHWEYSLMLVK